MTERVKVGAGYEVQRMARLMLEATAEAAKHGNGVMVHNMPGHPGVLRQWAARWLRQMGIPLYAQRKAENSVWFLLLEEDEVLASEWQRRILHDCYSEICRAHMALKPHQQFEQRARELQSFAVTIGTWLGHDLTKIITDLEPVARPPWVDEAIDGIVVE